MKAKRRGVTSSHSASKGIGSVFGGSTVEELVKVVIETQHEEFSLQTFHKDCCFFITVEDQN